uniref:Uncharacterized protein n=1 Tax=Oryza brachyantha TaxID=4533 RepID=J3MSL2_ORYBR
MFFGIGSIASCIDLTFFCRVYSSYLYSSLLYLLAHFGLCISKSIRLNISNHSGEIKKESTYSFIIML